MELCFIHAMVSAMEGGCAIAPSDPVAWVMLLSVGSVGVTGRGEGTEEALGAKKALMSARGLFGTAAFFLGGPSPMSLLENSLPR